MLELLYAPDGSPSHGRPSTMEHSTAAPHSGLRRDLQVTLARVATGCDTPDRLTRTGADAADVLLALERARADGAARARRRRPLPAALSRLAQ